LIYGHTRLGLLQVQTYLTIAKRLGFSTRESLQHPRYPNHNHHPYHIQPQPGDIGERIHGEDHGLTEERSPES
jgi:hypothetical protein